MDNLVKEINQVLKEFIQVDRKAHVLNGDEYWALERIAVILGKSRQGMESSRMRARKQLSKCKISSDPRLSAHKI